MTVTKKPKKTNATINIPDDNAAFRKWFKTLSTDTLRAHGKKDLQHIYDRALLAYPNSGGAQISRAERALLYALQEALFGPLDKSFYWNKQIDNGAYKALTEISKKEHQNIKYVKRAIRQRFLSPTLIEKITSHESDLSGSTIGVEGLSNLSHWCWEKQEQALLK